MANVTKYGNRVETEGSRRRNGVQHMTGLDSGTIRRGLLQLIGPFLNN